jgi:hypothetical protein
MLSIPTKAKCRFFAALMNWYPFLEHLLCLGKGNISYMGKKFVYQHLFDAKENTRKEDEEIHKDYNSNFIATTCPQSECFFLQKEAFWLGTFSVSTKHWILAFVVQS